MGREMDEALLGPSAASAPCIHGAVETPRTSRAATAGGQSQLLPYASIKQRQKRMPCPHFERLLSLLRERDLCRLLLWLLSSSLRLSLSLSRLSPLQEQSNIRGMSCCHRVCRQNQGLRQLDASGLCCCCLPPVTITVALPVLTLPVFISLQRKDTSV